MDPDTENNRLLENINNLYQGAGNELGDSQGQKGKAPEGEMNGRKVFVNVIILYILYFFINMHSCFLCWIFAVCHFSYSVFVYNALCPGGA